MAAPPMVTPHLDAPIVSSPDRQPLPQISLRAASFSVSQWLKRKDDEEHIDLHAPYQRGSVWTTPQRKALIKSLLMGVPVGSVVVSILPGNTPMHMRVVDGKQRVETIRAFTDGELAVPRHWFQADHLNDAAGADEITWSDLSLVGRRKFANKIMPALEFDGQSEWLGRDAQGGPIWRGRSPQELLQAEAEVFGLINFGGTSQTDQDRERAAAIARGV